MPFSSAHRSSHGEFGLNLNKYNYESGWEQRVFKKIQPNDERVGVLLVKVLFECFIQLIAGVFQVVIWGISHIQKEILPLELNRAQEEPGGGQPMLIIPKRQSQQQNYGRWSDACSRRLNFEKRNEMERLECLSFQKMDLYSLRLKRRSCEERDPHYPEFKFVAKPRRSESKFMTPVKKIKRESRSPPGAPYLNRPVRIQSIENQIKESRPEEPSERRDSSSLRDISRQSRGREATHRFLIERERYRRVSIGMGVGREAVRRSSLWNESIQRPFFKMEDQKNVSMWQETAQQVSIEGDEPQPTRMQEELSKMEEECCSSPVARTPKRKSCMIDPKRLRFRNNNEQLEGENGKLKKTVTICSPMKEIFEFFVSLSERKNKKMNVGAWF